MAMHPSLNHPLIDANLQALNSFGIAAKAARLSVLGQVEDALAFAQMAPSQQPMVWGGGSNVLLTKDYPGWVAKMEIKGTTCLAQNSEAVQLRVGAGENWHAFVQACLEKSWFGLENLSLIPGTVGAAPLQNIGAYGVELKDHCLGVEAIEMGSAKSHFFSVKECCFGYRSSFFKSQPRGKWIITHVHFQLQRQPQLQLEYGPLRQTLAEMGIAQPSPLDVAQAVMKIRRAKLPDPQQLGNAGSFFKNPTVTPSAFQALQAEFPQIPGYPTAEGVKIPAAWLIEACGWKGFRKGDAGVHHQQALVLVNHGQATGSELLELSQAIQAAVEQKFKVQLVPEVNVL